LYKVAFTTILSTISNQNRPIDNQYSDSGLRGESRGLRGQVKVFEGLERWCPRCPTCLVMVRSERVTPAWCPTLPWPGPLAADAFRQAPPLRYRWKGAGPGTWSGVASCPPVGCQPPWAGRSGRHPGSSASPPALKTILPIW
jgi:hypothetical protein